MNTPPPIRSVNRT
ncbi:hypothetical protein SMAC4_13205 [Sordaria macrospora]|nr:hypothetical protein SMAC4_13205 [Sordaria macrospora]